MCASTAEPLTLAAMLTDPMIQAMMRSDRVLERDYAALLARVKASLDQRRRVPAPARRLIAAAPSGGAWDL